MYFLSIYIFIFNDLLCLFLVTKKMFLNIDGSFFLFFFLVLYFLSETVREICLLAKSLRSEDSTSLLVFHAMYLRCLNKPEKEGGKVINRIERNAF